MKRFFLVSFALLFSVSALASVKRYTILQINAKETMASFQTRCLRANEIMQKRFDAAMAGLPPEITETSFTDKIRPECWDPRGTGRCDIVYFCDSEVTTQSAALKFQWVGGKSHKRKSGLCEKDARTMSNDPKNLLIGIDTWTEPFTKKCRAQAFALTLSDE